MTIFLFFISIALVIIAGKNFDKTEVKGDHTVKYLLIAAAVVGFFAYNLYAEDEKERLLESSRNAHELNEYDFDESYGNYNNGSDISFGSSEKRSNRRTCTSTSDGCCPCDIKKSWLKDRYNYCPECTHAIQYHTN